MTPFDLGLVGGHRGLDALVDAVVRAGDRAAVLAAQGVAERAELKDDRSLVTEADHVAEVEIRAHLSKHHPTAEFLGEETGAGLNGGSRLRFIVDPIDGTHAFVRGLPTWSTLLGLEHDGEPVLGIGYLPKLGDLYVAVRGHGARKNGRPLRVSKVSELAKSTVSHGSLGQFLTHGCLPMLEALANETRTQRGFADFHGHALVAEGHLDAMVDPAVNPWDLCASAVIVQEAGGRFSDFQGEPTLFARSGLSTNGEIHPAMIELLGRA